MIPCKYSNTYLLSSFICNDSGGFFDNGLRVGSFLHMTIVTQPQIDIFCFTNSRILSFGFLLNTRPRQGQYGCLCDVEHFNKIFHFDST